MSIPYGEDVRKRVLAFLAGGGRPIDAGRLFKIARSTASLWRRRAEEGRKKPLRRGPKRRNGEVHAAALSDFIAAHPHKNLAEIAEHFGVGGLTIRRRLRQMNYTFKRGAGSGKVSGSVPLRNGWPPDGSLV